MSLNYGIQCNVYEESDGETAIEKVKIHAYFYKVNDSSSDSAWDTDIRKTNGIGQVSFNLGDSSFLGSEGKIDNGDIVLITAWLATNDDTSTNDKSSETPGEILKCVNFIHTVDTSSSSWTEDFIAPDVKPPTCTINWPTGSKTELTGHKFTIENTSTVSQGSFAYNIGEVDRNDLYQNFTKYSQNLFIGRKIKETFYDLVETSETKDLIEDFTYSWVDSGTYDCSVKVYNKLGYYCEKTNSYTVKYNLPTIDFDYEFSKLLNSDKHIGVGNDDEATITNKSHTNYGDTWDQINASFDFDISDLTVSGSDNSDSYTDEGENFSPTKKFLSEGEKDVVLKIHWNDGFDNHTEEKTLHPFLDVYNIGLEFHWDTEKNYIVDDIEIPLGNDDEVSIINDSTDIASEDYDSTAKFKEITYTVTKKALDESDDSETFDYTSSDDFNSSPAFHILYNHLDDDPVTIEQKIVYWDGYQDITKTLSKELVTQEYVLKHGFHWETDLYGINKVVTRDDDGVSLINDSYFFPQNNTDNIKKNNYDVTKTTYASYTDTTEEDDSESFEDDNLDYVPYFFIRTDKDSTVDNYIEYYNGYELKDSTLTKTISAIKSDLVPDFIWNSRKGTSEVIEGRDDLVSFENASTIKNTYDDEQHTDSSRFVQNDWTFYMEYAKDNFSNPDVIGGDKFDESTTDNIESTLEPTETPQINYFTAKDDNKVDLVCVYNNGFYQESELITKNVTTVLYQTLEVAAY